MSESVEKIFHDEEGSMNNSYNSEDDVYFDELADEKIIPSDKSFAVLNEEEVEKRMHNDVSQVSSILSVSKEIASLLLLHLKFDVSEVHEAWFANEEKVREAVGLVNVDGDHHHVDGTSVVNCGICFEDYGIGEVKGLSCLHGFCVACWRGYISVSINDGPGCLFLKCPMPKCGAAVGEGFVGEFASDVEKEKYRAYMLRSYVEAKKRIKWCPFPDCRNAVEVYGGGSYDVTCDCLHRFCWNCTQEVHRPVSCEMVENWNWENANETANTQWILDYAKDCPKCKRAIEKRSGCDHMTCRKPCGHEFCWLCLGDWGEHGDLNCNGYKENATTVYAVEFIGQNTNNMMQRYMHYYERWASNHRSRVKARSDLVKLQSGLLNVISEKTRQEEVWLSFMIEAWEQIIECRRVLKWTYAYGYYIPEGEHAKKKFFEYLQGEAEAALEKLHRSAEDKLQDYYIDWCSPSVDFVQFRTNLIGLTNVTATYFKNLVTALENGLEDVDSHIATETHESSENNKRHKKIV